MDFTKLYNRYVSTCKNINKRRLLRGLDEYVILSAREWLADGMPYNP